MQITINIILSKSIIQSGLKCFSTNPIYNTEMLFKKKLKAINKALKNNNNNEIDCSHKFPVMFAPSYNLSFFPLSYIFYKLDTKSLLQDFGLSNWLMLFNSFEYIVLFKNKTFIQRYIAWVEDINTYYETMTQAYFKY